MAFQHIQCVGMRVYATICEECGRAIAWSPQVEILWIPEAAHNCASTEVTIRSAVVLKDL